MEKKNRIYIIITGVVAITLIWLSQSNRDQLPELRLPLGEELSDNIAAENVGALEGVLWSSDDEAKGNLMLVKNNATIYIRTSRDFSGLVGKYVIASIDGTLDNFTLLNIEENLTRDGFIRTP
ncbi:MAG TPA: hypothetical protein VJ046_03745 [Candidatus Paceibacterota bacterium]|nr:hypothetical protein [Candidatus Paceibacterota bacterium]